MRWRQRVGAAVEERRRDRGRETAGDGTQLALAIVSLGTGIPITAIAAGTADLPGLRWSPGWHRRA